jgi:23S rRNA maturation mini-RNase III
VNASPRYPLPSRSVLSTSIIYRSATGYELLMRVLYGRHDADRMSAVAARVPEGSSVVELW